MNPANIKLPSPDWSASSGGESEPSLRRRVEESLDNLRTLSTLLAELEHALFYNMHPKALEPADSRAHEGLGECRGESLENLMVDVSNRVSKLVIELSGIVKRV